MNELGRGKLIVVKAYANLVRMRFVDSNPPTAISPLNRTAQPRPPYTAVAYRGIYPGTDVILRAHEQRIAFQLNLTSGADPENVILELSGATGLKLDNAGNAIVNVGRTSFVLQKPVAKTISTQQLSSGSYKIENKNRLRFIVAGTASANSQTIGD